MKKIRSLIVPGLLSIGMMYALLAIIPLRKAYACTPAECTNLEEGVNGFCEAQGCPGGGVVLSCDSAGFEIVCNNSEHEHCKTEVGTCD
jgi:hypothetical protein